MWEVLRLRIAYRLTLAPDRPPRPDAYGFGVEGPKVVRPNEKRPYWSLFSLTGDKPAMGGGPFIPRCTARALWPFSCNVSLCHGRSQLRGNTMVAPFPFCASWRQSGKCSSTTYASTTHAHTSTWTRTGTGPHETRLVSVVRRSAAMIDAV